MKKICIRSNFKRRPIQMYVRLFVVIILCGCIISLFLAASASMQPKVAYSTNVTSDYQQTGKFSYTAYLKNNTVYDNATTFTEGQGVLFRKLIDHIDMDYTYNLQTNKAVNIQEASYQIIPAIKTNLWNKTIDPLIDQTTFNTNAFSESFPLNLTYFEGIVTQVDNETGIKAREEILQITSVITITATINQRNIFETFTQSINIPLSESIISFDGDLVKTTSDYQKQTLQETLQPNTDLAFLYLGIAGALFIVLILFIILTKNKKTERTEIERQVQKIKKKYGEWLVELDAKPKQHFETEILPIKTFDDLVNISEELGKPILLHHEPMPYDTYTFYVHDHTIQYKYSLKNNSFEDGLI